MPQPSLVSLVGGRVLRGPGAVPSTVLIGDGRIVGVGPEPPPLATRRLDVTGLTVLPGLVDVHTHPVTPRAMGLYVLQGITSVRLAGTALGAAAALARAVAAGEVAGPRVFSCGPILDEPPGAWPDSTLHVRGPAEAREAAAHVTEAEASALLVAQRVRPATLVAVVEAAHERGVPVTGQTWTTSVREAVRIGMDGVENTARLPENPRLGPDWVEACTSIGHRRARLVTLWRQAPQGPLDEVLELMAERRAVPAARARTAEGWTDEDQDSARAAIERIQRAVAACARRGGPLAVGTDVHPGGLFHHVELRLLAGAGLTTREVLDAATRGGARALRREADLGRVEPGALADLIAVESDPLADLAVPERPRLVLVGGRPVVRDGRLAATGS